jgi:hypothetical protein
MVIRPFNFIVCFTFFFVELFWSHIQVTD